jgi:antirestriction protein ArdC
MRFWLLKRNDCITVLKVVQARLVRECGSQGRHRLPLRCPMNLYEQVTATILSSLKRGVIPWRKPWSTTASIPVNAVSNRQYRGVNVLLLGLVPYSDHRWLTYKQVNEKGGSVRKGEKSTMVIFWKFPERTPETDQDQTEERKAVPILRYYSVFNAEQCDGLSLPEIHRPRESANQRIERAGLLLAQCLIRRG